MQNPLRNQLGIAMKKDTHPSYGEVLFIDSSTGTQFLCKSTLQTTETAEYEGRQVPCCRVSVSSASHPAFTGEKQFIDSEGRIDKFKRRYSRGNKKNEKEQEK